MNRINQHVAVLIAVVAMLGLVGCDTAGEQNFGWRPGDSLDISGPAEIEAGVTASYYVRAFTIDKSYSWNLDGGTLETRREGEFADVTIDTPGTYTLTVSNGEYDGSRTINVVEPEDEE